MWDLLTSFCFVFVIYSWKLPSEEVVHENGRVRRKAIWNDDNDNEGLDDGDDDEVNDGYDEDDHPNSSVKVSKKLH